MVLNIDPQNPEAEATIKIVAYIICGVDYYLIGIILLIFAFSICELFISDKISWRDQDIVHTTPIQIEEQFPHPLINLIGLLEKVG